MLTRQTSSEKAPRDLTQDEATLVHALASERAAAIFDESAAAAQGRLDARRWKVHDRLLDAVEWWVVHSECPIL